MAQEAPVFIDIPFGMPEDATEVLKDEQWHAAMSSPSTMSASDYTPLTFWINSKAERPLSELEYPSSGQCYRMEFVRDQGSWGREGSDLSCKGRAIIGDQELAVTLLAMGDAIFFHAKK